MSKSPGTGAFEQLYDDSRDRIYKALVLATDDRDLSLEAADHGYVSQRRRLIRRPVPDPRADVLRRALHKITKGGGGDSIRGFRLPDAETSSGAAAAVAAVRSLDLTDRVVLIARCYLGWDDVAIGAAVSLDPAAVALRASAASDRLAPLLHVDATDVERHLEHTLGEAAEGLSVPLSRLESVRSESNAQRSLAALGSLVGVVVLVGGAAVGWNAIQDTGGADQPTAADGAPVAGGGGTAATLDLATEVEWIQSGTPIQDGELSNATAGPDGFVAIGMNYNNPNGAGMMVLRSPDGIEWEIADLPVGQQSGGGWISSMAYADGMYVAAGTTYDERAGSETPQVYLSEDAETWTASAIPLEPTVDIDDQSLTVSTSVQGAAVSEGRITIVGSQYASTDLGALIGDNLPEGASLNNGFGTTLDGVEFYDQQGQVSHRATFEELGISAELASFFTGGHIVMWESTDAGETWNEVDAGDLAGGGYLSQIATAGDLTVAMVSGEFGGGELWSNAGDAWERVDLGSGSSVTAIAHHDGGVIVVGRREDGGSGIWRSEDGVAWQEFDDPVLSGMTVDRIQASHYGLVATGASAEDRPQVGPAIVVVGDRTVEVSDTGRFHVKDAEGATVVEAFGEDVSTEGDDITITDPASGEVVVTLSRQDVDAAWQEVWSTLEGQPIEGGSNGKIAMAVSSDGMSWVDVDPSAALPTGFYPNVAVLGESAILVAGYAEGPEFSGMATFVGSFGS